MPVPCEFGWRALFRTPLYTAVTGCGIAKLLPSVSGSRPELACPNRVYPGTGVYISRPFADGSLEAGAQSHIRARANSSFE